MFSIKRDFIRWEDKIVEVKRSYPIDRVKDVSLIKEWLGVDVVLRRDNIMYFCETIQDAEIIENEVVELPVKSTKRKYKKKDLDVPNE
jgi:hypothetical protein